MVEKFVINIDEIMNYFETDGYGKSYFILFKDDINLVNNINISNRYLRNQFDFEIAFKIEAGNISIAQFINTPWNNDISNEQLVQSIVQ